MSLGRYALLAAGVVLTALSAICAFTPVLWRLEGRPSESYPELLAFFYWLPAAVVVLIGGMARAFTPRWSHASRRLLWIGVAITLAVPVYTGLVLTGLSFSSLRAEPIALAAVGAVLVTYSWLIRKGA